MLGVIMVLIAYLLFDTQDQASYMYFLILPIGMSISQLSLYSPTQIRALRNLPIHFADLLKGKSLFYLLLPVILLNACLLLFRAAGMELTEIEPLRFNLHMLIFTSVCLTINALINKGSESDKVLVILASFTSFLALKEGVGRLPNAGVQTVAYVLLLLGGFYAFMTLYQRKVSREVKVHDLFSK